MTNNDLINKIKRLESVEPSKSWLSSNREFLFKYIDLDESKAAVAQTGSAFGAAAFKNRLAFVLALFQNRMLSGSIAVAAIFILAGGFVAGKAENSLPGDDLYAVKTFMEKTQLVFAYSDEKRVALNFELTEKRLDEFSQIASKKSDNSFEIKVAADNLNNQLKVAAQELNSVKNNSNTEKAVSVAKIVDTKTTAYVKKLNEVKKELSDTKKIQVTEVAKNVKELSNSALAVLATNSKIGDLNAEEIAVKLEEKIASTKAEVDETQENLAVYEAEIAKSVTVDNEILESLALSKKLIIEAEDVISDAQTAFDENNFAKTWDLLENASEIVSVAGSVGNRIAVAPDTAVASEPDAESVQESNPDSFVSPSPTINPSVSPASTPNIDPFISPEPSAEPSAEPSVSSTPVPAASVKSTVAPTPSASPKTSIAPAL